MDGWMRFERGREGIGCPRCAATVGITLFSVTRLHVAYVLLKRSFTEPTHHHLPPSRNANAHKTHIASQNTHIQFPTLASLPKHTPPCDPP